MTGSTDMREIPIFPLQGVVLFPGAVLPLHIFEPRYRQMISDVSSGDGRFGVINVAADANVAKVGCIAEIVRMEKMPDGRSNILTIGVERFKLLKEIEGGEYPRAMIKSFWENSKPTDIEPYVDEASLLLNEVFQLMARVKKTVFDSSVQIPKDAKHLSFWIASSLPDLPATKQVLLEMKDTDRRLAREITILDDLRKQLRAVVAIEDAFHSDR